MYMQQIYRHPLHILSYGFFGSGKDTFAATFPGPKLVLFLDGHGGNEFPYFEGAETITTMQQYTLGTDPWGDPITIKFQDVTYPGGDMTRIEYYNSACANNPTVSDVLEMRLAVFSAEEQDIYKTLIISSLTAANLEAMYMEQYIKNPLTQKGNEDPRQWRAGSTDFLERLIFTQKGFECNVIFIAHINLKSTGVGDQVFRLVNLPGRLATSGGNLFGNVFYHYVSDDPDTGGQTYTLQTRTANMYLAKTHLKMPTFCEPTYNALWEGWSGFGAKIITPPKEEPEAGKDKNE
jgi:hypothetical protein